MNKTDYKKELKPLYSCKLEQVTIVDVPAMNFLMIDGCGDPNTAQEYTDAIQALYPVAFALKFMSKKELSQDYSVMPLEGLWWADSMSDFSALAKSDWRWTMMIMQPAIITRDMFERAVKQVAKKAPSALSKVRFEIYEEGRAAQIMYVGAYADEGLTIQKLHAFIAGKGGKLEGAGYHHEIYLSDPRRTESAKLKTIIRQPYEA